LQQIPAQGMSLHQFGASRPKRPWHLSGSQRLPPGSTCVPAVPAGETPSIHCSDTTLRSQQRWGLGESVPSPGETRANEPKRPFSCTVRPPPAPWPLSPARGGSHASPGRFGDICLFPTGLNQGVPSSAAGGEPWQHAPGCTSWIRSP